MNDDECRRKARRHLDLEEAISVLKFYKAHKFVRDINVFTRDDFLLLCVVNPLNYEIRSGLQLHSSNLTIYLFL